MMMMKSVALGTKVRFWTGLREGAGRIGQLTYEGLFEVGGTAGVYIRRDDGKLVGFVALSHVEEITRRPHEQPNQPSWR